MSKNKTEKFSEVYCFPNVYQPSREDVLKELPQKGNWNNLFFNNSNPIVLELGCGKGEYTVNLAKKYPNKNFIGIDIKANRFWTGAKQAIDENLNNVLFIRTHIELIDNIFENEIDEIWITFPDPQIKYKRTKHRLTHPKFLNIYKKITIENAVIHLKTDSEFLHGWTLGVLNILENKILISQHDIYNSGDDKLNEEVLNIQTYYEKLFINKGKLITYLKFKL